MSILTVAAQGKNLQPTLSFVISFTHEDMKNITIPHNNVLVITTKIDGINVKRIFVDSIILIEVVFLKALYVIRKTNDLKKMVFPYGKNHLQFSGDQSHCSGGGWKTLRIKVAFIVVDALNSYHTILGCTTMNLIKIIATTCHQTMEYPTPHEIREVNPITQRKKVMGDKKKLSMRAGEN